MNAPPPPPHLGGECREDLGKTRLAGPHDLEEGRTEELTDLQASWGDGEAA